MAHRLPIVTRPSKPANKSAAEAPSVTRAQAAADALGSVRAEGLNPGRAEPLLAAWSSGELTDDQLTALSRRMLHDDEITAETLLRDARAG